MWYHEHVYIMNCNMWYNEHVYIMDFKTFNTFIYVIDCSLISKNSSSTSIYN